MEVDEKMLKALLELLYKTSDCLAIKIALADINMEEYPPCDMGECNEECPFYNAENMMKWVKEGE